MAHPTEPVPPGACVVPGDALIAAQRETMTAAGSVARLPSRAIFSGAQEVEIEHNGAVYRLRQTALGKLILTK